MKYLDKLEDLFVMTVIAIMGLDLGLQVFARYALNHPLTWSEELARYLFVWMTFIGASYGVRHNIHISMEAFYNLLPRPARRVLDLLTRLVAAAAFLALIPSGWEFVLDQNDIASSGMGIPMSWIFISVPVGCALVGARLIAQIAGILGGKGAAA